MVRWRGLRQDSGDPLKYIKSALAAYKSVGVDWRTKTIVFSDGLDVKKCSVIKDECDKSGFLRAFLSHTRQSNRCIADLNFMTATFGIGTSLTNDFQKLSDSKQKSRALNMVIKLAELDGRPCVKISDEITKVCAQSASK